MSEDTKLLRQYVAERSEAAFAALVQRHLGMVLRAAWRQVEGDEHRARDVAQEVFTLLARKAATLIDHTNLAGWLYSTTRHVVHAVKRAEQRRERREQEAHAMNEPDREMAVGGEQGRLGEELDEALRQLGAKDRDVLVLRFLENRPFAEVGEAMNVSEDAARMRADRALDKLRRALVRRGITSTAAALGTALAAEGAVAPPAGLAQTLAATAAAGGAAGAGGWLTFLATTKGVAIIGAAAVLLTTGVAWHEVAQARAQLLLLARETGGPGASKSRPAVGPTLLGQVGALFAQIQDDAERSSQGVEARWAKEREEQAAAKAAGEALFAAHPELKAQVLRETKAQIGGRNFLLYRELGWTAEQIATFEAILADGPDGSLTQSYQETHVDLAPDGKTIVVENTATAEVNLDPGAGLTQKETEERLQNFLGPEAYALYTSEKFMSYWPRRLAGALQAAGTPLSGDQATELVRAFSGLPRRWFWDIPIDRQMAKIAEQTGHILSDAQRRVLPLVEAEERADPSSKK